MSSLSLPPSFKPWLLLGGLVLLALSVRVFHESTESYERGVQALQDGDKEEAVFQFRTSAKWVMPGFSLPEESLLELGKLGDDALAQCKECPATCTVDRGEDCTKPACETCSFAVFCFDSGRAAIMGSRSLFTPHQEHLERMNEGLAQALTRAAEVFPPGPRQSRDTREKRLSEHREQMKTDHAPSPLPAFVVTMGFLCWILGLFLRIQLGGHEAGANGWMTTQRATALSFLGFISWVLGLIFL